MEKKLFDALKHSLNEALEHTRGERNDLRSTLAYKGYKASIEFDARDNIYVGRFVDTNDIFGFHGETFDEVVKSFEESVDFYIEVKKKSDKKTISK